MFSHNLFEVLLLSSYVYHYTIILVPPLSWKEDVLLREEHRARRIKKHRRNIAEHFSTKEFQVSATHISGTRNRCHLNVDGQSKVTRDRKLQYVMCIDSFH